MANDTLQITQKTKNKDKDSVILLEEICLFFDEISEEKKIFRTMNKEEREPKVLEYSRELHKTLNNYFDKNFYYGNQILGHLKNYVDNNLFDNITDGKGNNFRYNLSDIIIKSENTIEKDINKERYNNTYFKLLYNNTIENFRKILLYIDSKREDKINEINNKIYNIKEQIDNFESTVKQSKSTYKNLNHDLNESYKVIEHIEKTVHTILPQAITVVGILIAFLITYYGATSILDKLVSISEVPFYTFFAAIVITSHILFDTIFILFFLSARISRSSINIRCSKFEDINPTYRINSNSSMAENSEYSALDMINDSLKELIIDRRICANCVYSNKKKFAQFKSESTYGESTGNTENVCGQIEKFIHKYAYIFFVNIILFIIELSALLWWIVRGKIFADYIFEVANPVISSITIVLLMAIGVMFLGYLFYNFGKNTNRKVLAIRSAIFVFLIIATSIVLFLYGLDIENINSASYLSYLMNKLLL